MLLIGIGFLQSPHKNRRGIVGLDVSEIAPQYDNIEAALLGAKLI